MKLISFSHQDDYEAGRVLLHYRYQVSGDLTVGERVMMFAGDTHDQSCEANLMLGDFGFTIGVSEPQFKEVWLAELDEMTWVHLSQDDVNDYFQREHIPFTTAPSPSDWARAFHPHYDAPGERPSCLSKRMH